MKLLRSLPLYRGMNEYILGVRLAFDANDFGFQIAGIVWHKIPSSAVIIVIWFGECIGHAQNVGVEVVRYALQYTVRDVASESAHDVPESPCINCGPNKLGPVCSEDLEQNVSQLCKNVSRVGANGLQDVVGEG